MSKRLQVILEDSDYRDIQRAARTRHMSLSEWVRQALTLARRHEPTGGISKKLDAVRRAAEYQLPTADIEKMLAEIEAGHTRNMQP